MDTQCADDSTEQGSSRPVRDVVAEKIIQRAVGVELRRARDEIGWSRGYFVTRLPSGIGARTLLSYEHGTRHLTLLRFVEVCRALEVAAPLLLNQALQRARVHLEHVVLRVDLRRLVTERDEKFLPMVMWAHNKLVRHPDGVVAVAPSAVVEMADFMGWSRAELANYLARFVPDLTDDTTSVGPRLLVGSEGWAS